VQARVKKARSTFQFIFEPGIISARFAEFHCPAAAAKQQTLRFQITLIARPLKLLMSAFADAAIILSLHPNQRLDALNLFIHLLGQRKVNRGDYLPHSGA